MIRTYKRKLKLSKTQEQRLSSWIGACRVVYNMGLEIRKATYQANGTTVNMYALMRQLKDIKFVDWIADVPHESLEKSIKRLDGAFKAFFRTYKKGGGYPKFANKKRYKSVGFKTVKIIDGCVILPKIGRLKMFKDSEILGIPKNATIKIEPTGFFICIQCKDVPKKFDSENQAVGLDMGISNFCVNSNGDVIANPKHFEKYERRLRIENRSLARKKRGSNRWNKQVQKLAKLHHTIGNVRRDFLHKESTKIAKANSHVFVEDLKVVSMAKNKSLSKHILDCGWGMFREMLEYKTTVIRVDAKHTSQCCNKCGDINPDNRKTQSEFVCLKCGHADNADGNAAKNILSRGTAIVHQREVLACALGEESIK